MLFIKRHSLLLCLAAACIAPGDRLPAAPSPSAEIALNEYAIKAAAFYNIIEFTNWPRHAFDGPGSPLVVGILGNDRVTPLISRLITGETWRGRRMVVVDYRDARDVGRCQILFVAQSQGKRWLDNSRRLAAQPILAVSDEQDFAARGGNVQLEIRNRRLCIVVNLATTLASGIQLSSNLLRLSTIVGPVPKSPGNPRAGNEAPQPVFRISPVAALRLRVRPREFIILGKNL